MFYLTVSCNFSEEIDNDDDNGDDDDMECGMDAQSEEMSEYDEDEETETMTVTSEALIPAEKYDQQTDLTEEQEILAKIRGNGLWGLAWKGVDVKVDVDCLFCCYIMAA